MKKALSYFLSIVISVSCFSAGMIEMGKSVASKIEYKQAEKLYAQTVEMTGEIENRVVVTSSKKLDPMGAVQTAGGYDDIQVFQYETKEQAEKALRYYSALDYVESADYDQRLMPATDEFLDNDDAKCYSSASSNIDDMIKLINENYSSLPEIKIAVIDSGCEDNDLTHDVVENLGNSVGEDNVHGTKVCGTIIHNTLRNVKIYSYDVGDTDGFSGIACTSAMAMARAKGCRIINMSYGAYETSTSQQNAVNACYNAGIILVAAAGNDGQRLTSTLQHYPSCYSNVIGIGALAYDRTKASYSNYGTGINYFTVGTSVRSYSGSSDVYWNGTSAATPIAVSIIANLLTADSSLTYSQIKNAVVTKISHENTGSYSYIDGYATLSALIGKSLPQADFTYDLYKNESTGYSSITFHCDDDVRIYCRINSKSSLAANNSKLSTGCYKNGETFNLGYAITLNAVAYGDGMRKSTERVITAPRFAGEGYTYNSSTSEVMNCQYVNDSVIEVPSEISGKTVTGVGAATFAGNLNVETIILPKSVTSVGAYAFANCPRLKKVIAPGVETLGRYAFENCGNLMFAYFPMVRTVYNCALTDCAQLTAIDIGSLSGISSVSATVFNQSNNIIAWNKTGHLYDVYNVNGDGTVTYKCTRCQNEETVTVTAEQLLEMWSPYIVGRTIDTTDYDSLFLFDLTGDDHISAKDYSRIIQLLQNN